MKRLIYITYLSLLVLFLISCQKENIVPAGETEKMLDENLKAATCPTYSYNTKNGVAQVGTMRSDYAIVGFKPSLWSMPQQQATILSSFPIFDIIEIESSFTTRMVTIVKLLPGTSCSQVQSFSKQLEKNSAVDFVLPVLIGSGDFSGIDWMSTSSEFFVSLSDPSHLRFLEQFARTTKTRIVDDFGDGVNFVLEADKNSNGSVLDLCSVLNSSAKVAFAEPSYYYSPFGGIRKNINQKETIALNLND